MVPNWLHIVSMISLCVGFACAAVIAVDEACRPQRMWIMNAVWPVTALFGGLRILAVFSLRTIGDQTVRRSSHEAGQGNAEPRSRAFPVAVANGALHCGSGCALGDIVAEWLVFAVPAIAVAFGWHSLFDERIYAVWIVDCIAAFAFGIVFQYFTIAPMRNLSVREGLVAAVKADALSLTAWQVGMYGFTAFATFIIFRGRFAGRLETDTVVFWFMMQIAMVCGFFTSYPANWWLIRRGIKERM